MSKKRGKDLVDKEYHSQPNSKPTSWVTPKWRPLSLKNYGSSSNTLAMEVQAPNNEEENQEKKNQFLFPCEETSKWSHDANQFYINGDATFCYSRFFDKIQLDADFWGSLLGYRSQGHLWPLHIEGWVKRMMAIRGAIVRKKGPAGMDWTILPPHFRSELFDDKTNHGAAYADGTNTLYPPFWEVRYVYIPLYVKAVEEWLLVRIDLFCMEMTQFWSNHKYSKNYSRMIHLSILDPFDLFFYYLLEEINYWERYKGPYISKSKRKLNVHVVNDEYLPKDGSELGGDSGVLVCMLMRNLVKGETVNMDVDFKQCCNNFRLFMADQFYKSRFVPA